MAELSGPGRHLERSFGHLPPKQRNQIVVVLGEFIGTFCFLFFAYSAAQVSLAGAAAQEKVVDPSIAGEPNVSSLLYISFGFGFSLAVNVWVFYRISGGLFNPAVTLGMYLIGAMDWFRALLVFVAQILGGIAAAAVTLALYPGPLDVGTRLSSNTSPARGLFIEMFMTAELVFTIFMLAAEKHKATYLAPIGIGFSLFIAHLSSIYYTGAGVNPVRAFSPDVVNGSFPSYHYIYWVGPFLGTLVAFGLYRTVKFLEYEKANRGQDFDDKEAQKFCNEEDIAPPEKMNKSTESLTGRGLDQSAGYGQRSDHPSSSTNASVPPQSGTSKNQEETAKSFREGGTAEMGRSMPY